MMPVKQMNLNWLSWRYGCNAVEMIVIRKVRLATSSLRAFIAWLFLITEK